MIDVALLGHTDYSYRIHPAGNGEITQTRILSSYLQEASFRGTFDLYELFGVKESPKELASLWLEDAKPFARRFRTGLPSSTVKIFHTYSGLLAACCEIGALGKSPSISRIYAFDDFSYVFTHLHRQSTLCMIQNLVAAELAVQQGIEPHKILYLPCQRLPEPRKARRPDLPANALVVGCAARMRRGKNIEFLLDAFEQVRHHVPNAVLFIKGALDAEWDDTEDYTKTLKQKLESLKGEPWFIWDNTVSSHDAFMETMQSFDVAVYPTGADDPPSVVIEQLALGTPTLLLDGGPRPSLFNGMALFAKHQGYHRVRKCAVPYFTPDLNDLSQKLLRLIKDASLREELQKKARPLALRRFGPAVTERKLPLLIEGAYHIHHQTPEAPLYRQRILDEWASDYDLFDQKMPPEIEQCVASR